MTFLSPPFPVPACGNGEGCRQMLWGWGRWNRSLSDDESLASAVAGKGEAILPQQSRLSVLRASSKMVLLAYGLPQPSSR